MEVAHIVEIPCKPAQGGARQTMPVVLGREAQLAGTTLLPPFCRGLCALQPLVLLPASEPTSLNLITKIYSVLLSPQEPRSIQQCQLQLNTLHSTIPHPNISDPECEGWALSFK